MTIWRFKSADHGDIMVEDFYSTQQLAEEARDKYKTENACEAAYCNLSVTEFTLDSPEPREAG